MHSWGTEWLRLEAPLEGPALEADVAGGFYWGVVSLEMKLCPACSGFIPPIPNGCGGQLVQSTLECSWWVQALLVGTFSAAGSSAPQPAPGLALSALVCLTAVILHCSTDLRTHTKEKKSSAQNSPKGTTFLLLCVGEGV